MHESKHIVTFFINEIKVIQCWYQKQCSSRTRYRYSILCVNATFILSSICLCKEQQNFFPRDIVV